MMIEDLIRKNRSCRRFYQNQPIKMQILEGFVNLARLSPSAGNLQPLKYVLSCDPKTNEQIFSCLSWAGYLKEWKHPEEGEHPSAYIIMLGDTTIAKECGIDCGTAAQSIMLGARETGLAGCIIGSIDRDKLRNILDIPSHLEIRIVLAFGKSKEHIVIESMSPDGDVRYWRDAKSVHHVPKRDLNDIIVDRFLDK